MKNNSFKFLSIAILAAVVLYFGIQGYRYITDPFTTTMAYSSQTYESIDLDGWIIRDEEAFSSDAATLSHVPDEGEQVGKGQTIAVAYSDTGALETVDKIEDAELQLQQLEFALSTYLDPNASLKLDSTITDRLLQLQGLLSQGDYSAVSEDVSALKAAVLKRSHTYSSAEEIQAAIDDVKGELASLRASLSGAQNITAPRSGAYSAICDGYESVLTPEIIQTLTPSALSDLHAQNSGSNVGKLIYDSRWYYAANIPAQQAQLLCEGQSVHLHFAKGFEQIIPLTVLRISAEENGQQTVVLSTTRYLAQTTQLRHQKAELILATYSGLRVPDNSLRVNEDGQGGVYCMMGVSVQFKPIDIVYRGDGYTLVKPTADAAGSALLRSGDEVIITANSLESGMVVAP